MGVDRIDVSKKPYVNDDFTIRTHRSKTNPGEDFIVFESRKCGMEVGFYGNYLGSVAIVKVPCSHGGTGHMIGLCGDCDAKSNDLKLRNGENVEGRPDMFRLISNDNVVDDSYDNIVKALGGGGAYGYTNPT